MENLQNLSFLIHIPVIIYIAVKLNNIFKSYPLAKLFYYGLGLKLFAGVCIGLLYFYYYGYGDTLLYHKDGVTLNSLAFDDLKTYFDIVVFDDFPNEIIKSQFITRDQPRAFFMIKILSILDFFTFGNYWINGLYFSFFSFIGMWFLANTLARVKSNFSAASAIAFLFYPSVIFWTSGVTKESLTLGSIGFLLCIYLEAILRYKRSFCNTCQKLPKLATKTRRHKVSQSFLDSNYTNFTNYFFRVIRVIRVKVFLEYLGDFVSLWKFFCFKLSEFIVSLLCIFIIWKLKYYYLAVLMPLFLSYGFVELSFKYLPLRHKDTKNHKDNFNNKENLPQRHTRQDRNKQDTKFHKNLLVYKLLIFCISVILLSLLATQIHWNLHFIRIMDVIVDNYYKMHHIKNVSNLIDFENLQPNLKSFLLNSPKALFSALFRPGIWEARNFLQILAGLENLLTLLLTIAAIYYLIRKLLVYGVGGIKWKTEDGKWKPENGSRRKLSSLLEICFLFYIIFLAIFLAFACPNLGTLMRYRVGFYPFFVYLLLKNIPLYKILIPRIKC